MRGPSTQSTDNEQALAGSTHVQALEQTMVSSQNRARERLVTIGTMNLEGILSLPAQPSGLVIFAHGSGSSRHSPRNTQVATRLQEAGLATLLFDLLSEAEASDRAQVFNIPLLAERLEEALDWALTDDDANALAVGLFGASTGAAAALVAAAAKPQRVRALVSRGGRPDLAGHSLGRVRAPTLLIVGGADTTVLELNREAYGAMTARRSWRSLPAPRICSRSRALSTKSWRPRATGSCVT
jgi:putative phosphoribosyl transferase